MKTLGEEFWGRKTGGVFARECVRVSMTEDARTIGGWR